MFEAFRNVRAAMNLLPRVTAIVMLLEELLDESVPGHKKKEIALDALEAAGLSERIIAVAGDVIDLVVSVLNAVGVFDSDQRDPQVTDESVEGSALDARMRAMRDLE